MSFFKNKTRAFMIITTVILVMFMAVSTLPGNVADTTGNVFGIIITPVQRFLGAVVNIAGDAVEFVFNIGDLDDENDMLKEQVSVLNSEVREASELKRENDRLRALLDLKEKKPEYEMVASNIISSDIDNWYSIFTLDCGSSDGINVDDTVITNDGLVGYIYEVGYNWAKVKTIIDPASSVSAKIERIDTVGMCDGDVLLKNSNEIKMNYIPLSSAVVKGDMVITSGIGGVYPKGINIGKVKSVSKSSDGLTQTALIEPGVKFDEIGEVFVMKKVPLDID